MHVRLLLKFINKIFIKYCFNLILIFCYAVLRRQNEILRYKRRCTPFQRSQNVISSFKLNSLFIVHLINIKIIKRFVHINASEVLAEDAKRILTIRDYAQAQCGIVKIESKYTSLATQKFDA